MTSADALEKLRRVAEPELGSDLVTLGLVRDVAASDAGISMTIALATPGSRSQPQIEENIRTQLGKLPDAYISNLKEPDTRRRIVLI